MTASREEQLRARRVRCVRHHCRAIAHPPETPEQLADRMRRQINAALPRSERPTRSAVERRWRQLRGSIIGATLTRGIDPGGWDIKLDHFVGSRIAYEPCDPLVAWRGLREVPRDARGTIVDFGCGRGLVLHLATRLGFQEAIGVEVNEELAVAAQNNLSARRRSASTSVVVADAATWPVPDRMDTAFLYCPFTGATFAAWLQRVLESLARRPRTLRLVYVYPFEEQQLLDSGAFTVVARRRGGRRDDPARRVAVFRHDP